VFKIRVSGIYNPRSLAPTAYIDITTSDEIIDGIIDKSAISPKIELLLANKFLSY